MFDVVSERLENVYHVSDFSDQDFSTRFNRCGVVITVFEATGTIYLKKLQAVKKMGNVDLNNLRIRDKLPHSNRLVFGFVILFLVSFCGSRGVAQTYPAQTNYQTSNNYIKSNVFRQEIARFEINVERAGKVSLPITQVPRVEKADVIKLRLLDEAVNGIKLDQSQWDWTLLVAFINPVRRMIEARDGKALKIPGAPVSEEIQFRKSGWYREYSFLVPYDSQPVFFLYPKPKYRNQLLKVVGSKYEEIRKLGDKTIELAGAYAQIGTFLGELQLVLNRNAQQYGFTYNPNRPNQLSTPLSPYNYSYPYSYGVTAPLKDEPFGLATVPMLNQIVEGLAKSFNISLPSCWGGGSSYGGSSGGYNTGYNSGYSGYSGSSYGTGNNSAMDFVTRAQCVARNVNLADFDISVTKMWQQGGVLLVAELQKKYPQLAYYINIAAAAIDFIIKAFQKSPLRIVPTIIQSSDNQGNTNGYGGYGGYNQYPSNQYSPGSANSGASPNSSSQSPPVKISLFADAQPSEGQFVTAYPIVVHKWQANPDPEIISLYTPILAEPCLHAGQNILKSTDLSVQWSEDTYSRDFRLVLSSTNGFKKEFPLRKNIGIGGWELNLTPDDMNQIPKINMALETELVGTRGFNEIRSPKFQMPIAIGGNWEITPESLKSFAVGGKRGITLRNSLGSCRCLQRVIYKPSFGGQFVYEASNQNNQPALQFSSDGREVTFEIDATNFQPGAGTLEVKTFGGEQQQNQYNQPGASGNSLPIKLYPAPPVITEIRAGRGDREILITGDRLDQIQSVMINAKRAMIRGGRVAGAIPVQGGYNPGYQTAVQNQPPVQTVVVQSSMATVSATGRYQNLAPNERVAVFEDQSTRITSDTITLELNLEDNRTFQYSNRFQVSPARPAIRVNELNEIDGVFLDGTRVMVRNDQVMVTPQKARTKRQTPVNSIPRIDLSTLPVVSIDKTQMTLPLQNVLTDYSFRNENLSIETRIENATTNPNELPRVVFDILDTSNLRLNFSFNEATNRSLAGRRLQFRIRDRERGDSDWYTIRQTFVRIPEIESVKCAPELKSQCRLIGENLDYIAGVSIDAGRTWSPQNGASIQVQPTAEGKTMMMIPLLLNPKFLQIKLRDYPKTEGLTVSGFAFSNTNKRTFETPEVRGQEKNRAKRISK